MKGEFGFVPSVASYLSKALMESRRRIEEVIGHEGRAVHIEAQTAGSGGVGVCVVGVGSRAGAL